MSEASPRLGLPMIQPAQAQKHVTHNEALQQLDLLVQLSVEAFEALDPPTNPQEGRIWALGATPGGDWAGQGGKLAAWLSGGWVFVTPRAGWRAAQGSALRIFVQDQWQAPDFPALENLDGIGGNTGFNPVNRLSISSPASLFSHAGQGHQMKLNKASETETTSLLFQSDWSGRAEIGLAGSDDLSIKVSADGSTWSDAMIIDRSSGQAALPNGVAVQGPVTLPAGSLARSTLAQGQGLSVIGRAASSAGPVADIAAASNHQVLRRSGSSIGFGPVALNQSAAVSGTLGIANGGTGAATAAQARVSLGLGSAAQADLSADPADTTPGRVLQAQHGYSRGNLLGSVTQSAGQPTGAVIERGQNANGDYIRFADGTQICWNTFTATQPLTVSTGAGFRSNTELFSYPASFAFPPGVAASTETLSHWVNVRGSTLFSVWFRRFSFVSSSDLDPISYIAVGRWF